MDIIIRSFEIRFDLSATAPRYPGFRAPTLFQPVKLGQVFLNGTFEGTCWKILKFSTTVSPSELGNEWSVSDPVDLFRLRMQTKDKIDGIMNLQDHRMRVEIVPVPVELRTSRFSPREYELRCSFPARPEAVKFNLLCQVID